MYDKNWATASLVEANAAMDSLVEREDSDPKARKLKAYEHQYHDFKKAKEKEKFLTKLTLVRLILILY